MKWNVFLPAEEEIIEGFRLKSWDNITLSVVCRRSFFIANNAIGKPPAISKRFDANNSRR